MVDEKDNGKDDSEQRLDIDDFLLSNKQNEADIKKGRSKNAGPVVRGISTSNSSSFKRKFLYVVFVFSSVFGVYYFFSPEESIIDDTSFNKIEAIKHKSEQDASRTNTTGVAPSRFKDVNKDRPANNNLSDRIRDNRGEKIQRKKDEKVYEGHAYEPSKEDTEETVDRRTEDSAPQGNVRSGGRDETSTKKKPKKPARKRKLGKAKDPEEYNSEEEFDNAQGDEGTDEPSDEEPAVAEEPSAE